ncbi:MAG: matrixin family metalloprotease [Caldilineaceae bacterium]|nr:matrixin family metalloprotease [Caldilineaceae bacterium]
MPQLQSPILILLALIVLSLGSSPTRTSTQIPAPSHNDNRGLYLSSATTVRADNPASLAEAATLIVRGKVTATHSRWTEDTHVIVTDVEIAPLYTLRGQAPATVTVTVEGGALPDEGIAMASSRSADFATDEHVLLFLRPRAAAAPASYELVADAGGVFTVAETQIYGRAMPSGRPLTQFYADLLATDAGQTLALPGDWQARETAAAPVAVAHAAAYVYNNYKWAGDAPIVDFYVNVNSEQTGGNDGTVDDFRQAIIAAADTWNQVESAAFAFRYAGPTGDTTAGYNGTNAVMFVTDLDAGVLGVTRYWYSTNSGMLLEADVVFNDLVDLDTTGAPDGQEIDLQTVALHEFGHWLSLGHDDSQGATMYPSLMPGTLKRTLAPNDIAGIGYIYPCANVPCLLHAPVAPTATPTVPPTPTLTPTVMPTATPTSMPTATSVPTATPMPTATPTNSPTPGGTLPPTDAVTVPADETTSVTFTADDGLVIALTISADSVEQTTALAQAGPSAVPDVEGYVYTGYGFQLQAFVDGVLLPELPLARPATLVLSLGQAAATETATFALLRREATGGAWVDATCPAETGEEAAGGDLEFSICVLGELALTLVAPPADVPVADAQVFLPLVSRP